MSFESPEAKSVVEEALQRANDDSAMTLTEMKILGERVSSLEGKIDIAAVLREGAQTKLDERIEKKLQERSEGLNVQIIELKRDLEHKLAAIHQPVGALRAECDDLKAALETEVRNSKAKEDLISHLQSQLNVQEERFGSLLMNRTKASEKQVKHVEDTISLHRKQLDESILEERILRLDLEDNTKKASGIVEEKLRKVNESYQSLEHNLDIRVRGVMDAKMMLENKVLQVETGLSGRIDAQSQEIRDVCQKELEVAQTELRNQMDQILNASLGDIRSMTSNFVPKLREAEFKLNELSLNADFSSDDLNTKVGKERQLREKALEHVMEWMTQQLDKQRQTIERNDTLVREFVETRQSRLEEKISEMDSHVREMLKTAKVEHSLELGSVVGRLDGQEKRITVLSQTIATGLEKQHLEQVRNHDSAEEKILEKFREIDENMNSRFETNSDHLIHMSKEVEAIRGSVTKELRHVDQKLLGFETGLNKSLTENEKAISVLRAEARDIVGTTKKDVESAIGSLRKHVDSTSKSLNRQVNDLGASFAKLEAVVPHHKELAVSLKENEGRIKKIETKANAFQHETLSALRDITEASANHIAETANEMAEIRADLKEGLNVTRATFTDKLNVTREGFSADAAKRNYSMLNLVKEKNQETSQLISCVREEFGELKNGFNTLLGKHDDLFQHHQRFVEQEGKRNSGILRQSQRQAEHLVGVSEMKLSNENREFENRMQESLKNFRLIGEKSEQDLDRLRELVSKQGDVHKRIIGNCDDKLDNLTKTMMEKFGYQDNERSSAVKTLEEKMGTLRSDVSGELSNKERQIAEMTREELKSFENRIGKTVDDAVSQLGELTHVQEDSRLQVSKRLKEVEDSIIEKEQSTLSLVVEYSNTFKKSLEEEHEYSTSIRSANDACIADINDSFGPRVKKLEEENRRVVEVTDRLDTQLEDVNDVIENISGNLRGLSSSSDSQKVTLSKIERDVSVQKDRVSSLVSEGVENAVSRAHRIIDEEMDKQASVASAMNVRIADVEASCKSFADSLVLEANQKLFEFQNEIGNKLIELRDEMYKKFVEDRQSKEDIEANVSNLHALISNSSVEFQKIVQAFADAQDGRFVTFGSSMDKIRNSFVSLDEKFESGRRNVEEELTKQLQNEMTNVYSSLASLGTAIQERDEKAISNERSINERFESLKQKGDDLRMYLDKQQATAHEELSQSLSNSNVETQNWLADLRSQHQEQVQGLQLTFERVTSGMKKEFEDVIDVVRNTQASDSELLQRKSDQIGNELAENATKLAKDISSTKSRLETVRSSLVAGSTEAMSLLRGEINENFETIKNRIQHAEDRSSTVDAVVRDQKDTLVSFKNEISRSLQALEEARAQAVEAIMVNVSRIDGESKAARKNTEQTFKKMLAKSEVVTRNMLKVIEERAITLSRDFEGAALRSIDSVRQNLREEIEKVRSNLIVVESSQIATADVNLQMQKLIPQSIADVTKRVDQKLSNAELAIMGRVTQENQVTRADGAEAEQRLMALIAQQKELVIAISKKYEGRVDKLSAEMKELGATFRGNVDTKETDKQDMYNNFTTVVTHDVKLLQKRLDVVDKKIVHDTDEVKTLLSSQTEEFIKRFENMSSLILREQANRLQFVNEVETGIKKKENTRIKQEERAQASLSNSLGAMREDIHDRMTVLQENISNVQNEYLTWQKSAQKRDIGLQQNVKKVYLERKEELDKVERLLGQEHDRIGQLERELKGTKQLLESDINAILESIRQIRSDFSVLQNLASELENGSKISVAAVDARIMDMQQAIRLLELRVRLTLEGRDVDVDEHGYKLLNDLTSSFPPVQTGIEEPTYLLEDYPSTEHKPVLSQPETPRRRPASGLPHSRTDSNLVEDFTDLPRVATGLELEVLYESWYKVTDPNDRLDVAVQRVLKDLRLPYRVRLPKISTGIYLAAEPIQIVLVDGIPYCKPAPTSSTNRHAIGTAKGSLLYDYLKKHYESRKAAQRSANRSPITTKEK